MHSLSQTHVKEDGRNRQEKDRQKQRVLRNCQLAAGGMVLDATIAERPKCFWWCGPTLGESHSKLVTFLLFSTAKVM